MTKEQSVLELAASEFLEMAEAMHQVVRDRYGSTNGITVDAAMLVEYFKHQRALIKPLEEKIAEQQKELDDCKDALINLFETAGTQELTQYLPSGHPLLKVLNETSEIVEGISQMRKIIHKACKGQYAWYVGINPSPERLNAEDVRMLNGEMPEPHSIMSVCPVCGHGVTHYQLLIEPEELNPPTFSKGAEIADFDR